MVADIRPDLKAAVFRAKKNEYFVFGKGKSLSDGVAVSVREPGS